MAENMTLGQVRDYHHLIAARHEAAGTDGGAYEKHMGMRDAIHAHVVAVREVIAWHRAQADTILASDLYHQGGIADRLAQKHIVQADKLAQAIGDKL